MGVDFDGDCSLIKQIYWIITLAKGEGIAYGSVCLFGTWQKKNFAEYVGL